MRPWIFLRLLSCAEGVAHAQPHAVTPPATRTVQHVDEFHSVKVADLYRWLEDERDAEMLSWVDARNARTRSYLDQFTDPATRGMMTLRGRFVTA